MNINVNLGKVNWVQTFALLCVAVTSAFFGYLAVTLINILASPGWCAKAIQADKIVASNTFQGLTACVDLLKMQVGSLSKSLLVVIGTFALCLGVLVVIVIAGARLSLEGFGVKADTSRDTNNAQSGND